MPVEPIEVNEIPRELAELQVAVKVLSEAAERLGDAIGPVRNSYVYPPDCEVPEPIVESEVGLSIAGSRREVCRIANRLVEFRQTLKL